MMPLSGKPFTVQDGLDKYNEQVEYYSLVIRKNERGLSREKEDQAFKYFTETCAKMCLEALKTAQTGYDIPRGTQIEKVFYQALGYSDAKILEIQRSYD